MYWRAFDRAEDLDNKLDVVRRLTELYLQRNQLDRLLTRLQHQEREDRPGGNAPSASQGRDVSMCLAQAYASSGDIGSARSELERLLAANTRDTQLLAQLSKLAEEEGDIDSAARYQKQLVDLAPSDEGFSRLGQLYARSGDLEEAQGVWSKLAAGQGSALHVTMAMDSLLFHQKPTPVLETTEAMLRKDPHDWEALYRRGVAAAQLDRPDQAAQAFRALLEVTISDDEKSALAKAQARNPRLQPPNAYPMSLRMQGSSPMENRLGVVVLIRYFCRLETTRRSRSDTPGRRATSARRGWRRWAGWSAWPSGGGTAARRPGGLDPQAGREAAGRPPRHCGTGSTCAASASTTPVPTRRPASSAARRPPTRSRSGRTCTAWETGRPRSVNGPSSPRWGTWKPTSRRSIRPSSITCSRASAASNPGVPSWPRRRSSSMWTMS